VEEIIQLCFTDRAENTGFRTFQQFYFNTDAQSRSDYFNLFRKHYSLQGVDNGYIDNLNRNKDAIFKGIRDKDLLGVYKEFFYKQKITHGATHRDKSLGSFFTKLCHTVEPELYTPMDNPMRTHFGLQDESFPMTMLIISSAFKKWCDDNPDKTKEIKQELALAMSNDKRIGVSVSASQITDMKLMDMIYWAVANSME
jgi:hypothetical protein